MTWPARLSTAWCRRSGARKSARSSVCWLLVSGRRCERLLREKAVFDLRLLLLPVGIVRLSFMKVGVLLLEAYRTSSHLGHRYHRQPVACAVSKSRVRRQTFRGNL